MPLLLIRHAHTAVSDHLLCGRNDVPLDALGYAQADALARSLAVIPIAAVYSSPLRRATQTAAAIAAAQARVLEVIEERSAEEMDFGAWTGQRFDLLSHDPRWCLFNQQRAIGCAPSGESIAALTNRMTQLVTTLVERHRQDVAVLVSHAEPIRVVVLLALALNGDDYWQVRIDPASVTLVDGYNGQWRVRAVNECLSGSTAPPFLEQLRDVSASPLLKP